MSKMEQNLLFLFRNTSKAKQLWLLATLAEIAELPAEFISLSEDVAVH